MRYQSVTKEQMAMIDRLMVKGGITVTRMMELAGLDIALAASGMCTGKKIAVLCGKGNNGGDGIAAARHLANFGFEPAIIFPFKPSKLSGEPRAQLAIARKIKIRAIDCSARKSSAIRAIRNSTLVIDALLGYNLKGNPRGWFATLIEEANNSGKQILSVDVPSGLDATAGKPCEPCIRASSTITLTLPKKGLLTRQGRKFAGKIYVGYMSVPRGVFTRAGLKPFPWNPEKLVESPRIFFK